LPLKAFQQKEANMKIGLLASTFFVLGLANAAAAQDGAYFGLGVGVLQETSAPEPSGSNEVSADDFGLALTAGYRFPSAGATAFGVEGNLDLMSGKLMDRNGNEACPGFGPTWCHVDAVARLRGTVSTDLAGGGRVMGSLGVVVVRGQAEDGPGVYVGATGRGLSVGVSWENSGAGMPVRVDLNYDAVTEDNANNYDRSLDMIGLRVSYMF